MKPKKHPHAEIGRFSGVHFTMGLSAVLLICWQALELQVSEKGSQTVEIAQLVDELKEDVPMTEVLLTAPPPPPPAAPDIIQIVEDIEEIKETLIVSSESSQETYVEEAIIKVEDLQVEEAEEEVVVPFAVIERVPQFPGCEGVQGHEQQKACFNQKMQEHIRQHFKYPPSALEMNISGRVYVQFIIGSDGRVTGIQKRGPDRLLEQEAERIIALLPTLRPGQQRGRAVSVRYGIPINFVLAQ